MLALGFSTPLLTQCGTPDAGGSDGSVNAGTTGDAVAGGAGADAHLDHEPLDGAGAGGADVGLDGAAGSAGVDSDARAGGAGTDASSDAAGAGGVAGVDASTDGAGVGGVAGVDAGGDVAGAAGESAGGYAGTGAASGDSGIDSTAGAAGADAGQEGSAGAGGGEPCFANGDCPSGATCTGGTGDSLCLYPREACLSHDDCKRSEFCDGAGHCEPAAGAGEPCSPGSRCGAASSGFQQLWCDSGTHTCVGPLPIGSDCASDAQCRDGTVCHPPGWCPGVEPPVCGALFWDTGCNMGCDPEYPLQECGEWAYCDPSWAQCVDLPHEGDYCLGPSFCGPGLHCEMWACVASPGDGEPCYAGCTDPYCSTCAYAHECISGTCVREATHGESCAARPCQPGLRCTPLARVGGHCT